MPELNNQIYSFDEDGMLRLQKDLNYMFHHLDDNNVRRLYTEYCDIRSEEGETEIDGPLLIMRGQPGSTNSSTIRLKAGWDAGTSEFVFNLYDQAGNATVELDSTGDAVFRGDINTEEDIYVGNRIFLGWNGSTVLPTATLSTRGMYYIAPGSTQYLAAIYSTIYSSGGGSTIYAFEIDSSGPFNLLAKKNMAIYEYGEFFEVGGANTTDHFEMASWNNRMAVNQFHTDLANVKGTFIGGGFGSFGIDRSVYLESNFPYFGNRVMTQNEARFSLQDDLRYFYSHNNVFITRPTTDWTRYTSDTFINGTTRVITSTRGAYMYAETSSPSPVWFGAYSAITSLDLTQFHDGTAMTSDDTLVMLIFYANSTTYYTSMQLQLGSGSTDNYTYSFTSGLSAGWNFLTKKLGAYNGTTGNPAFNNIAWVRTLFRASTTARAAGTAGIYVDYLGIVRSNSTGYSAFQRDVNSTHENIYNSSYHSDLVYKHNDDICLQQITVPSAYVLEMPIKEATGFKATLSAHSHRSNESPSIAFYGSSYYIIAHVSSGVLRLKGSVGGTTFGDTINCESYPVFSDIEIGLKRRTGGFVDYSTSASIPEDVYTAWFYVSTSPESYREISKYTGVSTSLVEGDLYIGSARADSGMKITDLVVEPYTAENA